MKTAQCHPDRPHAGRGLCKRCYNLEYYARNRERLNVQGAAYHAKNRERMTAAMKRWYSEHREKKLAYEKQRYPSVRKHKLEYQSDYRKKHPEAFMMWWRKSYYENPNFRLAHNLRSRLWGTVRKNRASSSALKLIGCSLDELRAHLESGFSRGMTWDNYGRWHIDHIVPIASFDLSNDEQLERAFNFTNLQPLWAKDNQMKGARLPA